MKIKRLRYNRKKVFIGLFLFLVLLGLSVGFAFVTTKLSIDGVARVKDARWDVHFTNYQAMTGSVELDDDPTVTGTNVTFAAKLEGPGSFYGFTIDVVNAGTINAEIGNISVTPDLSNNDYLEYIVMYNDNVKINIGDVLEANGGTKRIKVLLKYVDGIDENLYPTTDQEFNITVSLNYQQHTGALPSFANDSWDAISGNPANYSVGDTKTIQFDLDGDNTNETYTLRVANTSTPAECKTTGFSQTACGFVLEFTQTITDRGMNPYTDGSTNGDGNKGGWEYSDMRAYINSGKYLEGIVNEIDYATTGVYDKLPSEIKNVIINTTVVSGCGASDSANFTTTDKLYLLSTHEVWEDDDNNVSSGIDYYDKAYSNTRQLDYYKAQGETTSNFASSLKRDMSGESADGWWLRAVDYSNSNYGFWSVVYDASPAGEWSDINCGVSPAFRIAG